MNNRETEYLLALVAVFEGNATEEMQQTITDFESRHSTHDIENIRAALETIVYDTANGHYDRDTIEISLYNYDDFLRFYVLENMEDPDFKEGFEFVFDKLSDDEQRRFIFWQYVRHADDLFANNSGNYECHMDRCLFWIAQVY